jgi:hypothetical protein
MRLAFPTSFLMPKIPTYFRIKHRRFIPSFIICSSLFQAKRTVSHRVKQCRFFFSIKIRVCPLILLCQLHHNPSISVSFAPYLWSFNFLLLVNFHHFHFMYFNSAPGWNNICPINSPLYSIWSLIFQFFIFKSNWLKISIFFLSQLNS